MAKITKKLSVKYTTIDTNVLTDHLLSYKAKGIYSYLISRPDNWEYNMRNVINTSTDGRESVQSGIKELESYQGGLLKRIRSHDEFGKFKGWDWEIYDTYTMSPTDGSPVNRENRLSEKPSDGKPTTRNKEYKINKFKKNDLNNLSLEIVDFKTFKKQLLESCPDFEFKLPYPNKLKFSKEHKGFKLKNGYIYDHYNDRFLNKDESFLVWDELYIIQERVFIAMKAQLSIKNAS